MITMKGQILIGIMAILPTLFLFYILIEMFPYTGLERIVYLPSTFFLNATIIVAGLIFFRKFNHFLYKIAMILIIVLTIYLTLVLYPQPGGPSIFKQIDYSVSAIKQYDQLTSEDLKLPLRVDFSRQNGTPEKYVVALYKYRKEIPLDGSYHIYRENEKNELKYWKDTSINSTGEIQKKLEGHHKAIWLYLEIFR